MTLVVQSHWKVPRLTVWIVWGGPLVSSGVTTGCQVPLATQGASVGAASVAQTNRTTKGKKENIDMSIVGFLILRDDAPTGCSPTRAALNRRFFRPG
jgi:hypothetical protein